MKPQSKTGRSRVPDGLVYVDGEFVPAGEAKISVFDHGFLYGDGIFEGIRVYDGLVFRLEDHVRRLYESALAIRLRVPVPPARMAEVVCASVARNHLRDAYVRLVVSRGPGDLGLDPSRCPWPTVVCIADAIQLYPPQCYTEGLRIITASTRRNLPEALNPRIKSLNYLNNILGRLEASDAGVLEALMLTHDGWVAEGTGDNIFVVSDGDLLTPAPHHGILKGITRACVIELARAAGLAVRETTLSRFDVYTAGECFLTGTAAEVIPVVAVDGRPIGDGRPGPITGRLMDEFRKLTRSEGTPVYPESGGSQVSVAGN